MKIKKYDEFINEESKIRNYIMSALIGLGLSSADAQKIDTIDKANIIEVLYDYNKSPYDISELKKNLRLNNVVNVDDLIQSELIMKSDKTFVIKPSFLSNIELYLNLDENRYELSYKIEL
jgi:hypothetical protein